MSQTSDSTTSHKTAFRNSSSSTTTAPPASPPPPYEASYNFHWICPRPACHTCNPKPRATRLLKPDYFKYYEAGEVFEHETGLEEVGAVVLENCTPECAARQVHVSSDARTGKEWDHVQARCDRCGRVAGRNACLVEVVRS